MRAIRAWLMRWRRPSRDEQIDKELRFHLEQHVRDLIASGLSPGEAERRARLSLGGVAQVSEQLREVQRPRAWLEQLFQDARMALRSLRRTPGITVTAIVLIALVIGGNTTIYSIVHGLLTKPAPGIQADRLVTFGVILEGRLFGPEDSYPNYQDYAAESTTIRGLMAYQFDRFTLGTVSGTYGINGVLVTANYFDTLGLRLTLGRPFTEAESRLDASGLVAIVSHRVWQQRFQGAADVLGQPILVSGHPATIVGVAPPRYTGATLAESADVWLPLLAYARVAGREAGLRSRAGSPTFMMGQLAPDATIDRARAEFAAISARLQAAYPETNRNRTITVFPYFMIGTGSGAYQGLSRFVVIFTAVAIVTVLIVCANVANLMLVRAAMRQRDTAVRQSLGASRGRLVRGLLIEGLLVSLAAWGAACVLASWMARAAAQAIGRMPGRVVIVPDFTPDWQVFAYAMALAALSTCVFTLAPAMRVWRQDPLPWLRAGEQGIVQGRSFVSSTLVIVQLACSILLLTCAGLAYRSLSAREGRELGFDADRLLLVTVNTAGSAKTAETNQALLDRVRARLNAAPGVAAATVVSGVPGAYWAPEMVRTSEADAPVPALRTFVGPRYLSVIGVRPLLGRDIDESTAASADANRPMDVVITQNLAEAMWPGQSVLDRTLRLGTRRLARIVGVAPNGFYNGLQHETLPNYVFVSRQQEPAQPGEATFCIRADGLTTTADAVNAIAPTIGRALRDVDAQLPIVYLRSMDTQLSTVSWPMRAVTGLFMLFALTSLVIGAIGLYAVITFNTRRRIRDFGLRMALGASSAQIVRGVIREGFQLTAIGLVAGFALSVVAGIAARSLLFGVRPTDPSTYLGVLALLATVSLLASYLPARRAARVDPTTALRHD